MSSTPPPADLPGRARPADSDPAMARYLASVDLRGLDIDESLLQASPPGDRLGLVIGVSFWAFVLGAVIWLPTTLFYQRHPMAEGICLGLWLMLALLTVLLLRSVTAFVAGLPWAQGLDLLKKSGGTGRGFGLSPKAQRQTLAGAIVALGALLVLVLPRDVQWQGQGYSGGWFLATLGAIATGILVGRFIIAHAASRPIAPERPPIVLPTWWRWVTLGWIVLGGIGVLVAHSMTVAGDTSNEFGLAGAGLFLGISGAIWLARRFDELEAKWQKEARLRHFDADADP